MYKAAIIFTFLLYQVEAKCKFSDQTKELIKVNYTFNQQNEVDFESLEISGFENLKSFFEDCRRLAIHDVVEFSLQYRFNEEFGSKLWKQLGKPFDVLNKPKQKLNLTFLCTSGLVLLKKSFNNSSGVFSSRIAFFTSFTKQRQ